MSYVFDIQFCTDPSWPTPLRECVWWTDYASQNQILHCFFRTNYYYLECRIMRVLQSETRTLWQIVCTRHAEGFHFSNSKSKIRISNHQTPYVAYNVILDILLFFYPALGYGIWCCFRFCSWAMDRELVFSPFTFIPFTPIRILQFLTFFGISLLTLISRIHDLPPLDRFKGRLSYLKPNLTIGEISF